VAGIQAYLCIHLPIHARCRATYTEKSYAGVNVVGWSGRCAVLPIAYTSLFVFVFTAPTIRINIATMSINYAQSCSQLDPNFTPKPTSGKIIPLAILPYLRVSNSIWERKKGENKLWRYSTIPSFLPAIFPRDIGLITGIDTRSSSKCFETQCDIRCFIVTSEKTRSIAALTPRAQVT